MLKTLFSLVSLLLSCPSAISETTIGFDNDGSNRFIVIGESSLELQLCVLLYSMDPGDGPEFTVSVTYQSRTAVAGEDFIDDSVGLTLSANNRNECFIFTIINDDIYEVREELFINLTTTDPTVTLIPDHRIVMIQDDDNLLIRWQEAEYTVREEEGSLEVCAELIGTHSTTISLSNILLIEGTATVGVDYRPLRDTLEFLIGEATTHCYTINIIINNEFEDTKEFMVQILSIDNERIEVIPLARIVLIDYNVIVQQQPQNICEGLQNLFNNTLLDGFVCEVTSSLNTTDCDRIECFSPTESISLSTLPCNRSITMVVMDKNSSTILVNSTLFSMPHPQTLDYVTPADDHQNLNISVEVVTSNGSDYYLVMLESSFGLHFPMTAIPLTCPQTPTDCCTDDGLSPSRRSTYIIIAGVVGGTAIVILIIGTCLYASVKINSKKRKLHPLKSS